MSGTIKYIRDDIFFFHEDSALAHWCTCFVRATQSKCCGTLDFLSSEPCEPNDPELYALITRFRELCSSVSRPVWVASQKDWRNQGSTGWSLAMHWYSIWVKMRFSCFLVLPGSEQAHVIWGGTVKHLLIAYFVGNISAKKYQNVFTCVKVIANQMWDVFWDTV